MVRQGKKPVPARLQSRPLVSNVGPLPVCTEPNNRSITVDVLVQSPVIEKLECSAPTSLPSSVPVVETLLSQTDSQLTPPHAQVLVQTSFSDILAYPASISRKDSDNVSSNVPGRTTFGVHHVEFSRGCEPCSALD